MLRNNETPFAGLGFEQIHRDGGRMAVAVVRASYLLTPDGALTLAGDQRLVLSDEYDGPPATSPMTCVSDLVPFKPGADVTACADSFAPHGEAARMWTAGLRIGERSHVLRCHGPRRWMRRNGAASPLWDLSEAEPALSIPVDYRLAAGGRVIGDPRGEADAGNPIGAGLIDPRVTSPYFDYEAPRIDSADAPVNAMSDRPTPQGLGPIPGAWASRARHAGTYDDDWRARGGGLPRDHDYRFWNCAHPALRQPGYLAAGERIVLGRLTQDAEVVGFVLPDLEPFAHYRWRDGREVIARMNRDGLHLDLRGPPPWRVAITFRAWVEVCPRFHLLDLGLTDAAGAATLPVSGEHGLEEARA